MSKFTDFPEQPRLMQDNEGRFYFDEMMKQIRNYGPGEIIAVHRSGFSYAMWAAQQLSLPLGVYWPKTGIITRTSNATKIVFVDDNTVKGETFLICKEMMAQQYRAGIDWRWAVLFTDWNTPDYIRADIISGARLPYFAEGDFWGSMKTPSGYGVRSRDEK